MFQPAKNTRCCVWVWHMFCPYCNHEETKVIDKRDSNEATRRRRECDGCGKRFNTYEKPEIIITVVKRDGAKEPYSRDKLRAGIMKSCEKRPIAQDIIDGMVSDIESRLLRMDSTEITSSDIGALVLKKLLKTDKVAYLRFASVYREFDDLLAFEKEVKMIKSR